MDLRTVLLIVLSAVAAIVIVFYQYFYKNRKRGSLKFSLSVLRFIAIFSGLLLLVNPKFVSNDYYVEKANLIILADDSYSIRETGADTSMIRIIDEIKNSTNLNERYFIHQYAFGETLEVLDSMTFQQNNTDISEALDATDQVFVNGNNAVLLLTDGNQTLGKDYQYVTPSQTYTVYPVVLGDTTKYQDLSIGLLNINRYAFLNNKFPVETNIVYSGKVPVSKTVVVSVNGIAAYREKINFDGSNNSYSLNTLIDAKTVGIKTIKVEVEPLENEKNPFNNVKVGAVEVIDERTNVVLVSDMLHPDIGALKKAIESNEQRSTKIVKPSVSRDQLADADILILYQPNRNFKDIFSYISESGISYFTIMGTHTDWGFVNQSQSAFSFESTGQTEDILPVLNNSFGLFSFGDFNVEGFPPLQGYLGDLMFEQNIETILSQQIKGVNLDTPMFAALNNGNQRGALLFGENIWKWRAQTFRNEESFQNFDDFMGKLMLYLSSNTQKSRLDLDFATVFENAQMAKIRALYYDESFQFDSDAMLKINVIGVGNEVQQEAPMILKDGFYEVDLSNLRAGEYEFVVTVVNENLKRSGKFRILDFNPEKQLLSADFDKLSRLAARSQGKAIMPNNLDSLVDELSSSDRYRPVQKSRQNVVSLIDFRILLGVIILALALEWFIRKYNGLI